MIDVALRIPTGESTTGPRPFRSAITRRRFSLDGTVRTVIGHLFTAEQWPVAHVRLFARWLREHDQDRDRYADLKRTLVAHGSWGSDYTTANGALVLEIVNHARSELGPHPLASP